MKMNLLKDVSSARFFKGFHAVSTIIWGILIPVTIFTDLKSSIVWIALMSVWANFVGHFSSWQATRVEVVMEENNEL